MNPDPFRPAIVLLAGIALALAPVGATARAPDRDELGIHVLLAPFSPEVFPSPVDGSPDPSAGERNAGAGETDGGKAAAESSAPGPSQVAVWLQLPGSDLLEAARPAAGSAATTEKGSGSTRELVVEARVRALDGSGQERARFDRTVRLDRSAVEEDLTESSLRIHGDLLLDPGSYELDLQVAVVGTERRVVRRFRFEVPRRESGAAGLLPPFFVDDEGTAIVSRAESSPLPYAFLEGDDLEFVPDIAPVVTPDIPRSRLVLMGYHLLRDEVLLDAALVAATGDRLGKDRLLLVGRSETAENGLDRLYFSLETEGLRPGDYRVEVTLHDLSHGQSHQTFLPFRARAADEAREE